MGDLSEIVKKGDRIQVFSADGAIDKRIYIVNEKVRSTINLTEESTKKPHVVHKSRVAKIVVSEELSKEVGDAMNSNENPTPQTPPVVAPQATDPAAPAPTAAPVVAKKEGKKAEKTERVDFKSMLAAGHEIWSKGVDFTDKDKKPIDGIKAECHCVFALDLKSFRVFNTYNGTMGQGSKKKANPDGVTYQLADEKAVEKKRADLKKKGYKSRKSPK